MKLDIHCSYDALPYRYNSSTGSAIPDIRTPERPSQIFDPGDLAVANTQSDLSRLLSSLNIVCGSDDNERPPYPILDAFRSLQHFQAMTAMTLGSPPVQKVMSLSVANVAWSYPYLMHMLLAVRWT